MILPISRNPPYPFPDAISRESVSNLTLLVSLKEMNNIPGHQSPPSHPESPLSSHPAHSPVAQVYNDATPPKPRISSHQPGLLRHNKLSSMLVPVSLLVMLLHFQYQTSEERGWAGKYGKGKGDEEGAYRFWTGARGADAFSSSTPVAYLALEFWIVGA
jgi:hypothetical protein